MASPPSPTVSRDIGVLRAGWGYASIGDKISDIVLTRPVRWPWGAGDHGTPARPQGGRGGKNKQIK